MPSSSSAGEDLAFLLCRAGAYPAPGVNYRLTLRLALWDEETRRLVGFREIRGMERRAAPA